MLYSTDSEGENVPVAVDDPQVFQTKTSWSLQEILEQLALKINEDKISKVNISRSHLWEGALRGLTKKSFSPDNKVSVKFEVFFEKTQHTLKMADANEHTLFQ